MRRGDGHWEAALGSAAPGTPRYVWSVTKTATAVLLLRQAERGALSIDDPLARWRPDDRFPSDVTLRMLLNHTSGIPCCSSTEQYLAEVRAEPERPWSPDRFLAHAAEQPLPFSPGTGWRYSNTGYLLLRLLLERLTGRSFAEQFRTEVAEPLALTETRVADGPLPGETYDPRWVPTGVLTSTARDVARFYQALFRGQLVGEDSLTAMTQPVDTGLDVPGVEAARYGLGLWIADTGSGRLIGHLGDGPGSCAVGFAAPERDLGVAVLSDVEGASHAFFVLLALCAASR